MPLQFNLLPNLISVIKITRREELKYSILIYSLRVLPYWNLISLFYKIEKSAIAFSKSDDGKKHSKVFLSLKVTYITSSPQILIKVKVAVFIFIKKKLKSRKTFSLENFMQQIQTLKSKKRNGCTGSFVKYPTPPCNFSFTVFSK